MLMAMRLDSSIPRRFDGLPLRLWVWAVMTALATPAAGLTWPPQPLHHQETASGQSVPASQQSQSQSGPGQQTSGAEQVLDWLAWIRAPLESVSSPDVGALGRAFDLRVIKQEDAPSEYPSPSVELIDVGDLDGDGVPEVVVKLPPPPVAEPQDSAQSPASPAYSQGLYLLSWDGSHWKPSSLAASGQTSQFKIVRLSKSVPGYVAVVNVVGDNALPYPAIFQVREHEAELVWDSQVGDNRYSAFEHGRIEFQNDSRLHQTVMIETGRADPGLLEFEPGGRRGFNGRCVYHWDGETYVPVETEYSPGPDNSLYRFIAALHLHDFRGAYALIDPGKFLKTDTPTLEQFRHVIETQWREFLDDQVFQAREAKAGSPDALAFELPDQHYVYRPTLSEDGKFLLTGLERTVEDPGTETPGDSP